MKKFLLYRLLGEGGDPERQEELVAVEYGEDIEAVAQILVDDVAADTAELDEAAGGDTFAYAPEPSDHLDYDYEVTGVISPASATENILVDYIVRECEALPGEA